MTLIKGGNTMSETTQMQDFLTRQAKVCRDNCEIEKDLYKELGDRKSVV